MLSTPDNLPEIALQTSRTAYLRFHGKDLKKRYDYNYSDAELQQWADKLKELSPQRIFIYFNNDYHTHAIANARALEKMLQEK